MDILDKLNEQQRQAVTCELGPVLVMAGPGSGKTRVLTNRIAYVIQSMGIRPWQMLAVTFTNKAARVMAERVNELIGEDATRMGLWLGTFHAMCARILRAEAEYLPITSNYVIYDDNDQERVVKSALNSLNMDVKIHRPASIHAAISNAKNELISAENYPEQTYRDEVVKLVYKVYQEALQASNAVDFDDLLLYTAQILADIPAVREKYAQKFRYILVDEFQDTNLAQYTLLKQLASVHQNIFVVGDPDQSIYRWRGADHRNVQRFEKDFKQSTIIQLEQNYRSRQNILNAAMKVINQNEKRYQKNLFSKRGDGERLIYHEARDDYGEADYVVETIVQLISSKQFSPGDIAVMYRTNAQSRLLEEAFLQARLPYRLVGAQRFYGRREVKDMIAYLRLVYNPADEASLGRVINVPPRGIGDKTLLTLHNVARQHNTQPGFVLLDLARGADSAYWPSFTGRASICLADFGGVLASWRAAAPSFTVAELFDRIVNDLNYKEYIDDDSEEGDDRWENVEELKRLALEYTTRSLDEFLENVALVSDQDTLAEGNVPTLLTLHAAKGLEFGAVFIIGLDDGILPHSRSFDEPEQMEEERRLFYVGITRAKDKLYLIRAIQRGGRGAAEETYPSRFLDDVPAELLVGRSRTGRSIRGRPPETAWSLYSKPQPFDQTQGRSASVMEIKFRAGTHVRHQTWGEGIVLDSRIQDDDEIVDIIFESVGIKRLSASLANLTVVK